MKKHVKLYNRVFAALHEDDKFVMILDMTHDEVIATMTGAMEAVQRHARTSNREIPATLEELAEAALLALQCVDDETPVDYESLVPDKTTDDYALGYSDVKSEWLTSILQDEVKALAKALCKLRKAL